MSTEPVRVALVGATGYTGAELLRLASVHPRLRVTRLCARTRAGQPLAEALPWLTGAKLPPLRPFDAADVATASDFAVLALPHGAAQDAAAALLDAGVRVVDLSADHRFRDPARFAAVYGPHRHPERLAVAVYGSPELNRAAIARARLVGCPGCYPTSAILGLAPLLRNRLIDPRTIVIDSKSGTSGAGRAAQVATLYCEVTDGFKAYKVGCHRHTPEIEQELSGLAGEPVTVSFTPHLVPMSRGILSTIYARLEENPGDCTALCRDF